MNNNRIYPFKLFNVECEVEIAKVNLEQTSPKRRHKLKKGSILDEQDFQNQTQKSRNTGICWYHTIPPKHPMLKFVISRSPVQIRPSAP